MRLTANDVAWRAPTRTIIEHISLRVEPGMFLGLLGPNGSGKSTLLNVLAGIHRPSTGKVLIDDIDLHRMSGRDRARKIAFVEQQADTRLDLTVRQVVELGRTPHRGRWPGAQGDDASIVAEAMAASRISHLSEQGWPTLSGGERQRTHLARAMAQQPSLLLLDEPTNHLDLGHQIDLLKAVKGFGITTVAALHDLELAAAFCDQLIVLDHGHTVSCGTVEQVLDRGLLATVYQVDGSVQQHPHVARPHVIWSDVTPQRDVV